MRLFHDRFLLLHVLLVALLLLFSLTIMAKLYQTVQMSEYVPYKDMGINQAWDPIAHVTGPEDLVQLSKDSGANHFILAFILAEKGRICQPAWSGEHTELASKSWGINQIRAFQKTGGKITIAFGGEAGTMLSSVCSNPQKLAQAYEMVIRNYSPEGIDFDIEGSNLARHAGNTRMIKALVRVQHDYPHLQLSFTLPVIPAKPQSFNPYTKELRFVGGLTQDEDRILEEAVKNKLRITHINIMVMDFGQNVAPDTTMMEQYSEGAAIAVEQQLRYLFPKKRSAELWSMLSMTPMIGINDVWNYPQRRPECLTLIEAAQLVRFAKQHGMTQISSWSIDRDHPSMLHRASSRSSGEFAGQKMQSYAYQYAGIFDRFNSIG